MGGDEGEGGVGTAKIRKEMKEEEREGKGNFTIKSTVRKFSCHHKFKVILEPTGARREATTWPEGGYPLPSGWLPLAPLVAGQERIANKEPRHRRQKRVMN